MTDSSSPFGDGVAVQRVEVVTVDGLDRDTAENIVRDGSDTRRALDGYLMTTGVPVGGGGGGGGVVYGSPIEIVDLGDGTVTITARAGARIDLDDDGGATITIESGGAQ